jgi:hypothetical protein
MKKKRRFICYNFLFIFLHAIAVLSSHYFVIISNAIPMLMHNGYFKSSLKTIITVPYFDYYIP